jgi:hypothetical protein
MSRLCVFDLDDTVVHTSAKIHTESHGPLTTLEYARCRDAATLAPDAFRELLEADCNFRPAPYFDRFLQALDEGGPVAVVTARAMTEGAAAALLSRVALSGGRHQAAADGVAVYRCGAPDFPALGLPTDEERKVWAVRDFLKGHPEARHVEFVDDDPRNLRAVGELFAGLAAERPEARFRALSVPGP